MRANEAKKAVFLRIGALGDLLVGLAALVETIKLCKFADVYIVGNGLWLEIIQAGFYSEIKGIFVVENNKSVYGNLFLNKNGKWERDGEFLSLYSFLKNTDVFVNTRIDSLRYAWPGLFCGVKKRYGSAPWPLSLVYTNVATWLGKDPKIHERDAALRILEGTQSGRFFPRARHEVAEYINSSPLIQRWKADGGLPATKKFDSTNAENVAGAQWKKYWLINPTASRPVKAWPKEKFRDFVNDLLPKVKAQGFELKVIGSPKETLWLEFVADKKVGIVQPGSISDLIDVVAGAGLLVANTSSMQFISAMTKTPVVTLMGKARPEIWGPLGLHDKVVLAKLKNMHESQLEFQIHNLNQDDQETLAFNSIEVSDVVATCLSFI